MSSGTLYLVATPIGNLEDLSLRALRVLREVDRIACEDTRQTQKLLRHHQIATPTFSFHRYNEHRVVTRAIQGLLAGEDLALVTDGGTPSISDPGFMLAREATAKGIRVIPIPGASAPLSALVASGLPADRFLFTGFLPHRSGERRRFLAALQDREETLILFDSPRRVGQSLQEMAEILGERRACLCREMTKIHEEFRRGSLSELAAEILRSPVKGEVTLVVGGACASRETAGDPANLRREVERAMEQEGLSRRDAAREIARRFGIARREVYRIARPEEGPPEGNPEEET
jgi:16S rRNA (cytidine1402-2'-O)-methyltransferase